jgi:hypothetical protein
VHRHWLRVEYLRSNLPPVARAEERLPEDFSFLAYFDQVTTAADSVLIRCQVDLSDAEVLVEPPGLEGRELLDRRWPVLVRTRHRSLLLWARAGRDKAALLRALADGRGYREERAGLLSAVCTCREAEQGETVWEARGRFAAYMEHGLLPRPDQGLDSHRLLNLLIHRIFFDVRDLETFKKLVHRKIVHQLKKVKIIMQWIPGFVVEDLDVGTFPPVLTSAQEPRCGRLGLELPLHLDYRGPATASLLPWPGAPLRLEVVVRAVEGVLSVNLPPEDPPVGLWLGFCRLPQVEMELSVVVAGHRLPADWLLSRLLQTAGTGRMEAQLGRSVVLPNMLHVNTEMLLGKGL